MPFFFLYKSNLFVYVHVYVFQIMLKKFFKWEIKGSEKHKVHKEITMFLSTVDGLR